jgi:hypothetical protein
MKTPAEYQRDYRERKAAAEKLAVDQTKPYQSKSFGQFFQDREHDVQLALDLAGLPPLNFSDDTRGPASHSGEPEKGDEDGTLFAGYFGSIGRAELAVDSLLDAATALASIINQYKREAVEQALSALGDLTTTDPKVRRQEIQESIRLGKMLDRLEKSRRVTLPEYVVKGA